MWETVSMLGIFSVTVQLGGLVLYESQPRNSAGEIQKSTVSHKETRCMLIIMIHSVEEVAIDSPLHS